MSPAGASISNETNALKSLRILGTVSGKANVLSAPRPTLACWPTVMISSQNMGTKGIDIFFLLLLILACSAIALQSRAAL